MQIRQLAVDEAKAQREAALQDKKHTNALALEEKRFEHSSALELRQTSNAYLKDFLTEALGDNLERRAKFAEYFATMTEDNDLRQRWETYHNRVEQAFLKKLKEENRKEAEKFAREKGLADKVATQSELLDKIAALEGENIEQREKLQGELLKVRMRAITAASKISRLQNELRVSSAIPLLVDLIGRFRFYGL